MSDIAWPIAPGTCIQPSDETSRFIRFVLHGVFFHNSCFLGPKYVIILVHKNYAISMKQPLSQVYISQCKGPVTFMHSATVEAAKPYIVPFALTRNLQSPSCFLHCFSERLSQLYSITPKIILQLPIPSPAPAIIYVGWNNVNHWRSW